MKSKNCMILIKYRPNGKYISDIPIKLNHVKMYKKNKLFAYQMTSN